MYDYISFPNEFGHIDQFAILAYLQQLEVTVLKMDEKCHQYVREILCHLIYPQCPDKDTRTKTNIESDNVGPSPVAEENDDLITNMPNQTLIQEGMVRPLSSLTYQVRETSYLITICREVCVEMLSACKEQFLPIVNVITACCSYFPRSRHSETCVSYEVTCKKAPAVENGLMSYIGNIDNNTVNYEVGAMVTYECFAGFTIEGPPNATCQYSGEWSPSPTCILMPEQKSTTVLSLREKVFFFGGIPLICVILMVILCCGVAKCFFRQKSVDLHKLKTLDTDEHINVPATKFSFVLDIRAKPEECFIKRNKEFDSFVIYFSALPTKELAYPISSDEKFVRENILPKFDQEMGGKYKLCHHRRNFLAGVPILANIQWAIENSNSAIIILSQDFVDAYWCTKEFELCMWEHDKLDPSFRLFVILMQPKETLKNCTVYMENFFRNINYLEWDDQILWVKLDQQLQLVKTLRDNESRDEI